MKTVIIKIVLAMLIFNTMFLISCKKEDKLQVVESMPIFTKNDTNHCGCFYDITHKETHILSLESEIVTYLNDIGLIDTYNNYFQNENDLVLMLETYDQISTGVIHFTIISNDEENEIIENTIIIPYNIEHEEFYSHYMLEKSNDEHVTNYKLYREDFELLIEFSFSNEGEFRGFYISNRSWDQRYEGCVRRQLNSVLESASGTVNLLLCPPCTWFAIMAYCVHHATTSTS